MRTLNYQLKQLCEHNKDGSHNTQRDRRYMLRKIANDLHNLGYRGMQARSLKQKHVQALVNKYKAEQLSIGTLKNRLTALRWWAEKVGRPQVVAKSNEHYGIGKRELVAKTSKAQTLDQQKLATINDPYLKMSLELQAAFGLRREECIKFIPQYADRKDHIRLKSAWCKGGKARTVHIRTDAQREVLNRAHKLVRSGSLIPPHLKYVQQMRCYEKLAAKAGFSKLHGLRHAYAQTRYQELTGWPAPACGGPTSKQLTPEQKKVDKDARQRISRELGHEREQITAVYLGR